MKRVRKFPIVVSQLRRAVLLPLAVIGLAVSAGAGGQETGLQLAADHCGTCHRVNSDQGLPPPVAVGTEESADLTQAPSFRQIAADQAKDRGYLQSYIQTPHYPMPGQAVVPAELEAIIDYILSLRSQPPDW